MVLCVGAAVLSGSSTVTQQRLSIYAYSTELWAGGCCTARSLGSGFIMCEGGLQATYLALLLLKMEALEVAIVLVVVVVMIN